jgi:hypothetical protein
MKKLVLAATHLAALAIGFALGVYTLPILIAPPAPSAAEVKAQADKATFKGEFRRDLKDSDALHWDFKRLKPSMVRVGDVKTFKNFLVAVPEDVDPARYNTVIVWCERFSQFITAAKYR